MKDSLIDLIKKAQSHQTQNEFARKCEISSSNLTRIYRGEQVPSPALLKKISVAVGDSLLYERLMVAAGYWEADAPNALMPVKGLFNHRLRTLMGEAGILASDLSQMAGVPTAVIESYVNDEDVPNRPLELIKLAKALAVDTDYLSGESPYRTEGDMRNAYQNTARLSAIAEQFAFDGAAEFVESLNNLFDELAEPDRENDRTRTEVVALLTKVILFFRNRLRDLAFDFPINEAKLDAIKDPIERMAALYNESSSATIFAAEKFLNYRKDYIDIFERAFREKHPDIVECFNLNDDDDDELDSL